MGLLLTVDSPPLASASPSLRELIAAGVLVQRELITASQFASALGRRIERPISVDALMEWDEIGLLCPIAFAVGDSALGGWRFTDPYPVDDLAFRDERDFVPWDQIDNRSDHDPDIPRGRALYSEWQLLYAATALDAETIGFPLELLDSVRRRRRWVKGLRPLVDQHKARCEVVHQTWLPTIKALLRLQARHWPYIKGSSVLLIDRASDDYVDALQLEGQKANEAQVLSELGLAAEQVQHAYEWFALRARHRDPLPDDYSLLRLQPRRLAERRQGDALRSLDLADAAQMFRRFANALDETLPPDIDQVGVSEEAPRPLHRDRIQLRDALRRRGLNPYRLHLIVEGETEVRVITRLFEAFSGQSLSEAGLKMTDLGGDKLEVSRPMLEGLATYAEDVALLLDNENDVGRVITSFTDAGVFPTQHVTLSDPSFEEANFTAAEMIEIVRGMADTKGAELHLSEEQLLAAMESENQGRKSRVGMGKVLQRKARNPAHGAFVFTKPELGDAIAERLLEEITEADGDHKVVADRRPIVEWVLAYPLRATQGS